MAMFIILAVAENGSAQNRRYNRRYNQGVSKQQVKNLLKRIEERSDKFSSALNKSLDRSRLDGTHAEDRIDQRAHDLENATDELRREYDRNDTHRENAPEVRKVINAASAVNRIMLRRKFSAQAENTWVNLRAEINALARLFRIGAI